jgi:hypothetical protein
MFGIRQPIFVFSTENTPIVLGAQSVTSSDNLFNPSASAGFACGAAA